MKKPEEVRAILVTVHIRERGERPSRYRSAMVDYSREDATFREAHSQPVEVTGVPISVSVSDAQASLQGLLDRGWGTAVPVRWSNVVSEMKKQNLTLR